MKRVNLVDYFEIAEQLVRAKNACVRDSAKAGSIYLGVFQLPAKLLKFVNDDNGFGTCKHAAKALAEEIEQWTENNVMDNGSSPPVIDPVKFDIDVYGWTYSSISTGVDNFKSVFVAECNDVDIYSVGQLSIYKTSLLASNGSRRIPSEYAGMMPREALDEFDSAGRCLAFDLPTACGFHALRGVELVILQYLDEFKGNASGLRTWNDYVKAVQKLIEKKDAAPKPSLKVAAMLDRMRELDRNPLMHPRDTLDTTGADMLFSLSAITAVEMARDIQLKRSSERGVVPLLASAVELLQSEAPAEAAVE